MLDHVSLGVGDLAKSRRISTMRRFSLSGWSDGRFRRARQRLWRCGGSCWRRIDDHRRGRGATSPGTHLCFRASDRAAVDTFHRAALAAGGSDDGVPGLRPQYHADYYAAFVRDPDGHRIEAVCHTPTAVAIE